MSVAILARQVARCLTSLGFLSTSSTEPILVPQLRTVTNRHHTHNAKRIHLESTAGCEFNQPALVNGPVPRGVVPIWPISPSRRTAFHSPAQCSRSGASFACSHTVSMYLPGFVAVVTVASAGQRNMGDRESTLDLATFVKTPEAHNVRYGECVCAGTKGGHHRPN